MEISVENLYVVVVVVCLPTKKLGVLDNSSKHVHAFQIESTPILSFHNSNKSFLSPQMLENHGNISRAFVAFDKRGDGFVTLDELKRVLFNFAFPMSDKLFLELMDR